MAETFTDGLATDVPSTRIDADAYDEIYVVGDVHGCRETLEALLETLALGDDDLVLFVGDLVRKGPDSAGVLDVVRETANALSVRGNNEQKVISGRANRLSLSNDDVSFLESLPVAIVWDDAMVVHGGIDPRKPIADHSMEEVLTMRSLHADGGYTRPYWFERRRDTPRVFFGHTVLAEPFQTDWAVGLDTGCVHGGQLTAYRCSTGSFLGVSPPKKYVERSANSIVDPRVNDPAA